MTTVATSTDAVRTPDERFEGLPGFAFEPSYRTWDGLRLAHLDEGEGPPALMLHGEPTWSFLFRKMIPPLRDAGLRCVAPDYPGFGRSDKPTDLGWYSYDRHFEACLHLVDELDLRDVTLVAHDWGGAIGLRMAVERPERFSRLVLVDTPLFTGRQTMPPSWWQVHDFVERTPDVPVATLVRAGCASDLGEDVVAGYEAPFPDAASKAGPRAFPLRVLPRSPELPAARACWRTMKAIRKDDRPTLTLWGESEQLFPLELGEWVTGALRREPPVVIPGAGHFLPEDRGEHAAALIVDWLESCG
ncbi:MAG TPA: haloalkane dehalogenase [Thermoleophilaceae bacterium]|jgi:haloalkane dehalogenase